MFREVAAAVVLTIPAAMAVPLYHKATADDPAVVACEYFLVRRMHSPDQYRRISAETVDNQVVIVSEGPNAFGQIRRGTETCEFSYWDGQYSFTSDLRGLLSEDDSGLADRENARNLANARFEENETGLTPSRSDQAVSDCIRSISQHLGIAESMARSDVYIEISGDFVAERYQVRMSKRADADPVVFPTDVRCTFTQKKLRFDLNVDPASGWETA